MTVAMTNNILTWISCEFSQLFTYMFVGREGETDIVSSLIGHGKPN